MKELDSSEKLSQRTEWRENQNPLSDYFQARMTSFSYHISWDGNYCLNRRKMKRQQTNVILASAIFEPVCSGKEYYIMRWSSSDCRLNQMRILFEYIPKRFCLFDNQEFVCSLFLFLLLHPPAWSSLHSERIRGGKKNWVIFFRMEWGNEWIVNWTLLGPSLPDNWIESERERMDFGRDEVASRSSSSASSTIIMVWKLKILSTHPALNSNLSWSDDLARLLAVPSLHTSD